MNSESNSTITLSRKDSNFMISETNRNFIFKCFVYFILTINAVMMLAPFVWMLSTSVKTMQEAFRFPPTLLPDRFMWENYLDVWNAAPFGRFYINSIIVTVSVTLGQLITCSMGAYAFARLNFPGRDKLFLLYIATMMIPFQVIMIPMYFVMMHLNWIDTFWALIVPNIFSAYGTFLLRQFFKSIPMELEESVRMDGGGYFICFTRIILPLSKPALATLGMFVFLWSWNSFLWPLLVINRTVMNTLPLGITFFQGQFQVHWNLLMAAGTITMLPLIVVYIFSQKYFIEGITLTGMKS